MSDIVYRIIPSNHTFLPESTQPIDGAVKLLKMYIQAEKITWEKYESPTFVDCGGNLESINCPYCGSKIDFDIWQEMMDKSYKKSSFNDLSVYLSCCNSKSSLNDLNYDMDCGFARFVIEVLNPTYPPCKHDLHEASK